MANPTTNFGWQMPTNTDLVKDLPADFEVFGQAVDTDLADLKGGTTNQVLAKNSDTDLDFKWVADATGIPATIFDAKGDLISASAADTAARLAVGANGTVLTADSAEATGLKWVTPSGGGKILQVISATTTTETTVTGTSYADSGLSASITPSLNTSKILILISQNISVYDTSATNATVMNMRLYRDATLLLTNYGIGGLGNEDQLWGQYAASYLDSPATTSALTYKTQIASTNANVAARAQDGSRLSSIILLEVGA